MKALRDFLQSPLARHPALLGRKIATRLGLRREDRPVPFAPVAAVTYPAHWAASLREWIGPKPPGGPPPFCRVFGQDFDEASLLQLCRDGPPRDASGLTADIKLIWDYSRGHSLFLHAATAPDRPEPGAVFIQRWLEANGNTNGPAWTCAMEVAIRAVNWIFADALHGGSLGRRVGPAPWSAWLWRHGWLIWHRLEARLISSNHYLADLLGLLVIGAAFPEDPRALSWLRFAKAEFPHALLAQTHRDGGLDEASLRYHAFVTEMALLFRLASGAALPADAEARLRSMCRLVADAGDATGDVFPIGDDDSGRVLALDHASGADRTAVLLRLAKAQLKEDFHPAGDAIYPESGWWLQRAGDFAFVLDFGGVGLRGLGSHAHNDDFSFCLDWRRRPLIVDPGTGIYTGDPAARNRFRSTLAHNTLVVDDREQRELGGELFSLPGPAEPFESRDDDANSRTFTRSLGDGLRHRREVSVRSDAVVIRDTVEGSGRHRLRWRFHLHPAVRASRMAAGFALDAPDAGALRLESSEATLSLEIAGSEYSRAYGAIEPATACVASSEFGLPVTVTWTIRPA